MIILDEIKLRGVLAALQEAQTIDDSVGKWDRNSKAIFYVRSILGENIQEHSSDGWQPIETAPIGMTMFIVRGFNVQVTDRIHGYTTDPYGVWQPILGKFERWPHPFAPTHWTSLPATPRI
jgi:hypothetical protein